MRGPTRRRAALPVFFVVTFGVSWTCWGLMVAGPEHRPWLHLAGSLGPAVGGVVACWVDDGRRGLRRLGRRVVRWRVPSWVWAVAVLLPLGLYAAGSGVSWMIGTPVDWAGFFSTDELGPVGPRLVVLEIAFFGLGEEIGWRGFLLRSPVAGSMTPYRASSMFIPVWAAWHVPLFFSAHGLGDMAPLMIPGWLVSIALSTYLISWLFENGLRSVLVVAVFHGVVDLVSITSASSTTVLVVVNAGLVAASVLAVTRSRVLFTIRPGTSASGA